MKTSEIVEELRQLATEPLHGPDGVGERIGWSRLLNGAADRLERLDKIKDHLLDCESAIVHDPACLSEEFTRGVGI